MPVDDNKPKTTAALVEALATRYGANALPTTNKQFIVLQPGATETELWKKAELASQMTQALEESSARQAVRQDPAWKVLEGMSHITEPSYVSNYTWSESGIVVVDPVSIQKDRIASADEKTEAAFTLTHELGHANMAPLDQQVGGYQDFKFRWNAEHTKGLLSYGWEASMPKELLSTLRLLTNNQGPPAPASSDGFTSEADFKVYIEAWGERDQALRSAAIRTLHTVTSETYADAFAILSISAKDGPGQGVAIAEKVQAYRIEENKGASSISPTTHDSARGLGWLSSYLKSEQGGRLINTLASEPDAGLRAQNVHQTAMVFTGLNVRRWAQANGATKDDSQHLADWVTSTYHKHDIQMYESPVRTAAFGASSTPAVYPHSSETIMGLAIEVARKHPSMPPDPTSDRVQERVLEYSKKPTQH